MRTLSIFSAIVLLAIACTPNNSSTNKMAVNTPLEPIVPTLLPTTSGVNKHSRTDFENHVAQLLKKIPSKDFTIIVQPPFVVIGDEPPTEVKRHATTTVQWAVDKLKQDFFTKDPEEILDIWLFKDAASYEKHVKLLFNDEPPTPYGYYSPSNKALLMNISTGGGTLVHEIVHPFIEANFPSCPPWLNEGLGSLYEQCGEQDGHIHGFINWRLPKLQEAIKTGTTSSFKTLTSLDSASFYNDKRGLNYAQSRYLCYYLQEKGLLVKFYRSFVERQAADPTGYGSLVKILGNPNMTRFQKQWEHYVLNLHEEFRLTLAN